MEPSAVLGISISLRNNLAVIDSRNLLFACDAQVVLLDVETCRQKTLPRRTPAERITAIATTADRRHLAMAAAPPRGETSTVEIWKLETDRKQAVSFDMEGRSCDMLAFSEDSKLLATCLSDGHVDLWNWRQRQFVVALDLAVCRNVVDLSFCPEDSNHLLVIGKSNGKILKYAEGQMEPFHPRNLPAHNVTCGCWTGKRNMLFGTENYSILVVHDFHVVDEVTPFGSRKRNSQSAAAVVRILAAPKWVLTITSAGKVFVFARDQRANDGVMWTSGRAINFLDADSVPQRLIVLAACFGRRDDEAFLLLENGSIQRADFSRSSMDSSSVMSSATLTSIPAEELIAFHTEKVLGIQVCLPPVTRLLTWTTSELSIWNYKTHRLLVKHRIKASNQQQQSISFAALSPQGALQLVVATREALRFYLISFRKLLPQQVLDVANCEEVRYSYGGHVVACSYSSSTIIFVSPVLFSVIKEYFLDDDKQVRTVRWSLDDSSFMYCTADGEIGGVSFATFEVIWLLPPPQLQPPQFLKFGAASLLSDSLFLMSSDDRRITEISGKGKVLRSVQLSRRLPLSFAVDENNSSNSDELLLGFSNGILQRIQANDESISIVLQELRAHQAGVTQLVYCSQQRLAVSAAIDGSVVVWKLKDEGEERETAEVEEQLEQPSTDDDLVLCWRSVLENKNRELLKPDKNTEKLAKDEQMSSRTINTSSEAKLKQLETLAAEYEQKISEMEGTIGELETNLANERLEHDEIVESLRRTYEEDIIERKSTNIGQPKPSRQMKVNVQKQKAMPTKEFTKKNQKQLWTKDELPKTSNSFETYAADDYDVDVRSKTDPIYDEGEDSSQEMWKAYGIEIERLKGIISDLAEEKEQFKKQAGDAELKCQALSTSIDDSSALIDQKDLLIDRLQTELKGVREESYSKFTFLGSKNTVLLDDLAENEKLVEEQRSRCEDLEKENSLLLVRVEELKQQLHEKEFAAKTAEHMADNWKVKVNSLVRGLHAASRDYRTERTHVKHLQSHLSTVAKLVSEAKSSIQHTKALKECVLELDREVESMMVEQEAKEQSRESRNMSIYSEQLALRASKPSSLPPIV